MISVILPAYNAESFLSEAIESVISQSLTDWELIIANDGSTDRTLHIIEAYAALDPRISYFTQHNSGIAVTLNKLVDRARFDLIARMDSDDVCLADRLKLQLEEFTRSPDVFAIGTWAEAFGPGGNRIIAPPESNSDIRDFLYFGSPFVHPTVMFRKSMLIEMNLRYSEWASPAEDLQLWFEGQLIGLRMRNIPKVLLRYRQHEFNSSTIASLWRQRVEWRVRCGYLRKIDGLRVPLSVFKLSRQPLARSIPVIVRGNKRTGINTRESIYALVYLRMNQASTMAGKLLYAIILPLLNYRRSSLYIKIRLREKLLNVSKSAQI